MNIIPVPKTSDADIAFGSVKVLPKYSDIPDEFKGMNAYTVWNKLASDWFYKGLKEITFDPKPGVDVEDAKRAIKAALSSWAPKHEHKMAGVAYLMSQWFNSAEWTVNDNE